MRRRWSGEVKTHEETEHNEHNDWSETRYNEQRIKETRRRRHDNTRTNNHNLAQKNTETQNKVKNVIFSLHTHTHTVHPDSGSHESVFRYLSQLIKVTWLRTSGQTIPSPAETSSSSAKWKSCSSSDTQQGQQGVSLHRQSVLVSSFTFLTQQGGRMFHSKSKLFNF